MANSVAYYTPFLQKHLARWIEKDLPYRAHYYTNYADSLRMLVLLTYNPNTGEIVEIHGPAVSKDETENAELIDEHFTEMPAGACELAMGTGLTLAHLSQSWTDDSTTKGYAGDFGGLPFASVVKVSHPTEDADAVTAWMADNADLTFAVEDGAGKDEGTCRVARLKMKKYLDVSYTTVSFVQDTRSDAKSSRDARERAQFLTPPHAVSGALPSVAEALATLVERSLLLRASGTVSPNSINLTSESDYRNQMASSTRSDLIFET